MSGPGRCAIAPGLLTTLLVLACTTTGAAGHAADSPESKLRARIVDLHADVELMEVECAAARHNLLECLKKSGELELVDRNTAVSRIKDEVRQLQVVGQLGQAGTSGTPGELAEKLQREASKGMFRENKQEAKLLTDFLKGGDAAEKTLDRLAETEYQARLDSVRAEADRRKADFLKKIRALHQKKLELAEAEAEYKSSK